MPGPGGGMLTIDPWFVLKAWTFPSLNWLEKRLYAKVWQEK